MKNYLALKWPWNNIGVILQLRHIKALMVIELCIKFYSILRNRWEKVKYDAGDGDKMLETVNNVYSQLK